MNTDTIHYFGYGSLVNRDTRPSSESAWNARLGGWRRVWNHRVASSDAREGCTSLSVAADQGPGCSIDGVVVAMPRTELAGLDAREAGYERLALPSAAFTFEGEAPGPLDTIHMYRSLHPATANQSHPILRSYVDCVMAGYLSRFGEAGLRQFLSTTDGWEGTLLDDRSAPRYPRAVRLPADTIHQFDLIVASLTGA